MNAPAASTRTAPRSLVPKRPRTAPHWAVQFLLAGYRKGATGPEEYDCWGLVRAAVQAHHGCRLPRLNVETDDTVASLVGVARVLGWRPVPGPGREGDILLMRTAQGGRHVGYLVATRGPAAELRLLHCAAGGPVWQPVAELPAQGYRNMQAWRLEHAA